MSFLNELRAAFGPSQAVSDPNNWIVRAIHGGQVRAGTAVSEHSALNLPPVYRAVTLVSNCIAQLPLAVYKKGIRGGEIADQHPLNQVLRLQPNEDMSSFSLLQTKQHHVMLWGNGYAEIERNGRGEVVGLWPMLPDRTYPEKPKGEGLKYRTTIDGKQYLLPKENVLHIKALGFNGYSGYSPISLHRQGLALALSTETFGAKFFENDAKSGGFLQYPGKLSANAKQNLDESVNAQGGLEKAHRVKLLEEGMKFVSTTIPPEDAQFLGTRTFQIEEIARMFGVPPILLYSMEKTTSWGSGIEQLMIGFLTLDMQPWYRQWEQQMDIKLLTEDERNQGYYTKFNMNALVRGDMSARGAFYNTMFNVGAFSPNEIRAKEDMPGYEGGDDHRLPLNTEPAGANQAASPEMPSGIQEG